jgi:hypothetical protein
LLITDFVAPPIKLMYTNWKGETREREVVPIEVKFDISPYHNNGEHGWLFICFDLEKQEERGFDLYKCNFDY